MSGCFATRRGMTLVELLVVTGLIASLLGLVVTGLRSGGNTTGHVRRSAQNLASAFVAAQSRALSSTEGSGVIIDPTGGVGTTVNEALMQQPIIGEVTNGIPPAVLLSTSATIQVTPLNASAADFIHGYRILFLGSSSPIFGPTAWMSFVNPTATGGDVRFRDAAGQNPRNTIWPAKPPVGTLGVRIARYPDKAGITATMEKLAGIDLRNSGVGDDPTTPYGSLNGKGAIAVTFDRTGGLAEIMQQVVSSVARTVDPIVVRQPIYFLVAARADIADSSVNVLSRSEAIWVVVFPPAGRITVSSNVPQTANDAAALFAARANARRGIPLGK